MKWLQSLLEFAGSLLGWATKRDEEYNTPEMKARKADELEVNAVNRVEKAARQKDTEFIRKELAE
jgi:hypothetical protein